MPASPAIRLRTDWRGSIGRCRDGTDAVILELGANDMLRGIQAADHARCAGDDPAPADGAAYRRSAVRDARGAEYRAPTTIRRSTASIRSWPPNTSVLLYPFFLDGVAGDQACRSTTACIQTPQEWTSSSARILPKVEDLIARRSQPAPFVRVAPMARSPHAAAAANCRPRAAGVMPRLVHRP